MDELQGLFEEILPEGVFVNEPMKDHTTFRIGGSADYFLVPHSGEEISALREICRLKNVPCFLMGNGSDLLAADEGFRGAVIRVGKDMGDISVDGTCVEAGAGASLSAVAAAAAAASLTGFEFAGGIPGTLGGAVFMNAGAYGGEMKNVIESVTVLEDDGEERVLLPEELAFGYRTSVIRTEGYVVLSARIALTLGDPEEIRRTSEDLAERRRSKQPLEYPSAGSTFKRPQGYFAGKLIMDAGLTGASVGGAQVSKKHCGFIINTGNATAADVRALIRLVQKTVFEKEQVMLEPEVRFLGDFGEDGE